LIFTLFFAGCTQTDRQNSSDLNIEQGNVENYLDYSGFGDAWTGGVKMIPIQTAKGTFKVWTKRVGNNSTMKVLLLHGGPGATHEYLECFDSFLPKEGIEYYYYDQLESAYSDQPGDTSLWHIDRYVDEVEQVRKALGLDSTNFYLLGHSWGGILALEYGLKYQKNLKGLIISNMMSSLPDYIRYADEVLGPQLDPKVLADIKEYEAKDEFDNPGYLELIETYYYPEHILRRPPDEWPEPVVRSFSRLNYPFYAAMQGPSEFGVAGNARIKTWDRKADLHTITVPVLTIGSTYDTMDPEHMKWMAKQFPNGSFLLCPSGSHMDMYDDQQTYFDGLIRFIKKVNGQ
jgi:proline iminopeptidase